ncbi:hypothetical protein JOQ06_008140 [Pogonophryne albipinna]|uniref:Uncharacterized protein n=1 Tax=Pogonophryne albipinna TaxID=1090488 RepID=A0AAD6AID5_9TELE|nr:hypothetical protein JOQ06_008140 [Pogonophryne albipinna]
MKLWKCVEVHTLHTEEGFGESQPSHITVKAHPIILLPSRILGDPFSDRSCCWVVEMNGACEAHFTLFRIRVSLSLPGGNKQAGPRRISSPPVPQTPPPPDGMCEESRSPIGPGSCRSPLIPDALMGR